MTQQIKNNTDANFYLPLIWEEITDNTNFHRWDFLRPLIGRRIFWASVDWVNCKEKQLPLGYDGYVIKTEGPNVEWIEQQARRVSAPIFYCCLYKDYGTFDHLPNVHFISTVEWHYQFDEMIKVFGNRVNKNIKHKISALCHRGTQSKIVAIAALAQHIGLENCLISLHKINNTDVHDWQDTKNDVVDQCTHYFLENLYGNSVLIDQFNNKDIIHVHNFHHPAYLDSAININNESFHYSFMVSNNKERINPGPFITEKTLKCFLGETAFINNAQHDTYNSLASLGFKFDYGLDLTYDQDPGNISRMAGMLTLIKTLANYSAAELYQQTRQSCLHNKDHIVSGDFYRTAEAVNYQAIESILSRL
jgi:hypothetical protein